MGNGLGPQRGRPRTSTALPPSRTRQRALVVDGDDGVLAFAAEALHSFSPGFDVATARDLDQAEAWLGSFRPDLLIVDLDFADGVAGRLARRVREGAGARGCKIVALAGSADPLLAGDARPAGVAAVLDKPVRLNSLLATVRGLWKEP